MLNMLKIENLQVKVNKTTILQGVNLEIRPGEIHALMGQNGSGKSTLAQTIMGSPVFEVISGKVIFNGRNILEMTPDERSKEGIFLSFQYPSEVAGVGIGSFLRLLYNNSHSEKLSPVKFRSVLEEKMKILGMKKDFAERSLNEGFSGGEKKRMEMLQMLILEPKLAILDEVDSGLDIDALKTVSKAVNYLHDKTNMSVLLITHYARILKYIEPTFVHVMTEGEIARTGGKQLATDLEESGYSFAVKRK